MVGLNVGQAQVKFSQVWSQVFPVYLQIGEAVAPPLVKSRAIAAWFWLTNMGMGIGNITLLGVGQTIPSAPMPLYGIVLRKLMYLHLLCVYITESKVDL